MGSLAGKSISDLVGKMQSGETYVNVHTEANPNGEIRGQIISAEIMYHLKQYLWVMILQGEQ